jgi:predicted nuclease with TOPRIM domain
MKEEQDKLPLLDHLPKDLNARDKSIKEIKELLKDRIKKLQHKKEKLKSKKSEFEDNCKCPLTL